MVYIKCPKCGHMFDKPNSFGCQQVSTLQTKYSGVRVNKVAEATARFLADATDYCSDDGGIFLSVELKGLAPFQLIYKKGGITQSPITVLQTDLK